MRPDGIAGLPAFVAARHAIRIGVVLSAGGLRGAAHLGVMRRLLAAGLQIDVLVGVSAGAIVAGYYAGVGLSVEDMIGDAPTFKGRHVVMHGVTLRAPAALRPLLAPWCGVIPRRLQQLEACCFTRLHHGVQAFGVVCHDQVTNRPVYFSSAESHGARLGDVVKASAAAPGLMPTRPVRWGDRVVHLVDGGLSDALPTDFAHSGLGATHLIVSDCRGSAPRPPTGDHIAYVRPTLDGAGTWRSPAGTLLAHVAQGEAAVTPEVIQRIRNWGVPRSAVALQV